MGCRGTHEGTAALKEGHQKQKFRVVKEPVFGKQWVWWSGVGGALGTSHAVGSVSVMKTLVRAHWGQSRNGSS